MIITSSVNQQEMNLLSSRFCHFGGLLSGIKRKRKDRQVAGLCQRTKKSSGLVSLFNGISTLSRLFNAKSILLEEQWFGFFV